MPAMCVHFPVVFRDVVSDEAKIKKIRFVLLEKHDLAFSGVCNNLPSVQVPSLPVCPDPPAGTLSRPNVYIFLIIVCIINKYNKYAYIYNKYVYMYIFNIYIYIFMIHTYMYIFHVYINYTYIGFYSIC